MKLIPDAGKLAEHSKALRSEVAARAETEHQRLNREWSERIRYSRTPEGMAERAKWKAFLDMGRELVRSGDPGALVYPAEGNES